MPLELVEDTNTPEHSMKLETSFLLSNLKNIRYNALFVIRPKSSKKDGLGA